VTSPNYFGTVSQSWHVAGLRLTEVAISPGERLPRHAHEPAFFCLVLAGAHKERFGSAERIDRAFSLTCRPSGFEHQIAIGPVGERFFTVELGAVWTEMLSELDATSELGPADVHDVGAFSAMLKLHRQTYRSCNLGREPDVFAVESLGAELLAHSVARRARRERRRPAWLSRVVDYLEAHYMDPLRVRPLAREAGVHPVHLARVFRDVYRCSMAEYQIAARIRHACVLLGETDLPLAQIALATGFSDQSHFTRHFAALSGQPPGVFRRAVFHDLMARPQ
jgi:AraC family transcriptional regulator